MRGECKNTNSDEIERIGWKTVNKALFKQLCIENGSIQNELNYIDQ